MFESHINWVKVTDVPFLHAPDPNAESNAQRSAADDVPWLGVDVIVTRVGHAHKGFQGVVRNVLRGQATASTLKIEIVNRIYNPSNPFHHITVDYDDVVEAE